jgi:PAS domain S-box-containing protein
VIDARDIAINARVPPVAIEELKIDGRKFDTAEKIEAVPGRGDISIRYTALSFLAPQKVRFEYILEGYDREWVDAGDRRAAYYSNIPPGDYTFRVVAANNDGVWNEKGASVPFHIAPHYYQTAWFVILCVVSGGGFVIGVIRLRMRALGRREQELEALVKKRTAELEQQQEHLRRQRTFLGRIIDSNPSFVYAKDEKGRFTLANQALAKVYQTSVDEIIGKTEMELRPEDKDAARRHKQDLRLLKLNTGQFIPEEVYHDNHAGEHWMQVTKIPLTSPDDERRQLLGVATDISPQKMAAIQMQQAKEAAEEATQAKPRDSDPNERGCRHDQPVVGHTFESRTEGVC